MSSTRWSIGEQVQLRLTGGRGKQASKTDIREIYKAVEQVLNGLMKIDYFKTTLQMGDTTLDGLAIATYEGIPVATYRGIARLILPAMPMRLPHGMGVPYVGPDNFVNPSNILNTQFIPIPNGHSILLNGQPMIDGLLGQIGYEVQGKEVLFNTDITQPPNNITAAVVKLAVLDISKYGDYEFLPIAADMEAQCVDAVYAMFAPEARPAKIDDPVSLKENQPAQ